MRQKNTSKKLLCSNLHTTTILTAGGSATSQVDKSHASHVPFETLGAECMGTLVAALTLFSNLVFSVLVH